MREQYFKHRKIFDFNKETDDIGFGLPWKKGNEDNHFLFRLYRKVPDQYDHFYQHQLKFFLNQYKDATEQEFFNHVKRIVTDTISELINKDRYGTKHAQQQRNRLQLQEFLEYLDSIDRWFIQSTDQETIKRQLGELNKLINENKGLRKKTNGLGSLKPKTI